MKQLLALSLILLSPAVAFAQSSGEPAKKPAEKTAKAPAKKTETTSRTQLQSSTNQVAAGIRAADVALTPAELAIADRVYTGNIACELGASVAVDADPKSPGYFTVKGKGFAYRMHPVVTSTDRAPLFDRGFTSIESLKARCKAETGHEPPQQPRFSERVLKSAGVGKKKTKAA